MIYLTVPSLCLQSQVAAGERDEVAAAISALLEVHACLAQCIGPCLSC
jgi:hypothetical protein